MSSKNEAVKRKASPELTATESCTERWPKSRESLAEETRRVIKEAEEEISRSVRKEFEQGN